MLRIGSEIDSILSQAPTNLREGSAEFCKWLWDRLGQQSNPLLKSIVTAAKQETPEATKTDVALRRIVQRADSIVTNFRTTLASYTAGACENAVLRHLDSVPPPEPMARSNPATQSRPASSTPAQQLAHKFKCPRCGRGSRCAER
jgi:hypothetical protein